MIYPPRNSRRCDPWSTTIKTRKMQQPSRYMDSTHQNKLMQLKKQEESKHYSVKLHSQTPLLNGRNADACNKANDKSSSLLSEENNNPKELNEDPIANTHAGKEEVKISNKEEMHADCNEDNEPIPQRKSTKELCEEFKHLDWAKVDEFNSFKAKLEEEEKTKEKMRRKESLRRELEAQLREQKLFKENQKKDILNAAKEMQRDIELWKSQEKEKQRIAYEKMLIQKSALDTQMQERKKMQEETKAEQLRESIEMLDQVAKDIEMEKRRILKAKQQKAKAMQEILEVTMKERKLAMEKIKKEKEEDAKILELSIRLEQEAAERSKQEYQLLLEMHQSRADKIAMLTTVDKKELATQNALKRDAADQARLDALKKEEAIRKKEERMKVQEYLKIQQQEKQKQKEMEKQERYELQRLQEIDAQEYKENQEIALRKRRELLKRQQGLLLQQMEEHKQNKDILVSQTEMKLNRRLLEDVKEYLTQQQEGSNSRKVEDNI